MKAKLALAALVLLAACATSPTPGGPRMDWRCAGGAAFSARISSEGAAEVFAGGQVYNLPHVAGASGARYSSNGVEYWERGGEATLTGAQGGPYTSCRRG
jgi:membrane-bound inhibitor of C-type lysozyme